MQKERANRRSILAGGRRVAGVLFVIGLFHAPACDVFGFLTLLHGDCASALTVRGKLVNVETGQGVSGAAIGGRTFTSGAETDFSPPLIFDGSPSGPVSASDGMFSQQFSTPLMPCTPSISGFPPPDQVEVIVVRDGCEQRFLIDINEDTVVDLDFPGDVIELKDPIFVGPCEE